MRLTILGSGTLIPNDRRRSAAHLLEWEGGRLLLDCGFGSLHGMARFGIPWDRISHVALTHFHADHVGDLVPLLFALRNGVDPPRQEPMTVLGPRGTGAWLDALATAHGDWIVDPGFDLAVVELAPSDHWLGLGPGLVLRTHPTVHTDRSIAYRLESAAGTVGYTGDTGPDRALADFLTGCDLIVCECSHEDPPTVRTHLTPSGVAELARIASPRLVVTTHAYAPLAPAGVPDLIRGAGYSGDVVAGHDGLRVDLEAGEPVLAPQRDQYTSDPATT